MAKKPAPSLANLQRGVPGVTWDSHTQVLEVTSPHVLSRAAGYLKYALGSGGGVYFRGQTRLYPKMIPSLYRGIKGPAKNTRETALKRYIEDVHQCRALLNHTPDYAHEPLLQHYGIRTRWLDVVDNVWTALWFGCHEARATGDLDEYIHFVPSAEAYAYIILIQVGLEVPDPAKPGLYSTDRATVVDLRRCTPSLYLRPHAQHGLLFRCKYPDAGSLDLSQMVAGTIRVRTDLARSWLGNGELTYVHHVFPPPVYDLGYEVLLRTAPKGNIHIGAVQHVGA